MKAAGALIAAALVTWTSAAAAAVLAGTDTRGGAVPGGRVIHVTTLADAGPGSLRAAIYAGGPRIIVFDVGGVIGLNSDLKISRSNVTIAGQTAPYPGVTLTGGTLLIRANDAIVEHIAVRPGPGPTPRINGNRDSITVGGGKRALHDIRIENVSLSWSVDENLDIAARTRHVVVRNSIIAEALNHAGHPKGHHSMGMLINKDDQGVAVAGNLFVSNVFRNPVIARGCSAIVIDNYIVDPAQNAIHFYDAEAATPIRASIMDNVVVAGADTDSNVTAVQIPDDMSEKDPNAKIYLSNNQSKAGPVTNRGDFPLVKSPPVRLAHPIHAPDDIGAWVLRYAGMRPAARGPIDARIVRNARNDTSHVIDNPDQVGGLRGIRSEARKVNVPNDPFAPSDIAGMLRIEAWLCMRHLQVGGSETPECPDDGSAYRRALQART